ncbi:MAG: glutathione S-transferase N-terminal domain-containing protein [Gammaproteobacteria bacterium]|nr:glutathione S-transferase N-terminal domain-containing protein [Pseudomonadales bacterium]MCP5347948.1 glutathione S-transferase N-terminal domain-containing protein [Pseudomonadales bacterium]
MIDLYTWSTPNGRKVSIMLEETGLPYRAIPIDITQGEQHEEDFIRIAPNHKIPALVDHQEGMTLMESGAILLYLANKTGQLLSSGGTRYWEQMQWLMYQMGQVGPMLGQTHHFVKFNPGKSAYAEERYRNETIKVYQILDQRLKDREYLVEDYSVVDIATWPWISRYGFQQMDLHEYPNLLRWYLQIAARPAVQRGYGVPEPLPVPIP